MTTQTIKAIETSYAGCHFRSRIEARWAVFFDTLGIEWHYEPQGYLIGDNQATYLPDFWLPQMKIWAEVKGTLDQPTLRHLIAAAATDGLPHNYTGQPIRTHRPPLARRLLLLGPIPDPQPGHTPNHTLLYLVGSEVVSFDAFFTRHNHWDVIPFSEPFPIGDMAVNTPTGDPILDSHWPTLLNPASIQLVAAVPDLTRAYWSARSARFEHGQTGAPPTR